LVDGPELIGKSRAPPVFLRRFSPTVPALQGYCPIISQALAQIVKRAAG
jgi:hypothetical protein